MVLGTVLIIGYLGITFIFKYDFGVLAYFMVSELLNGSSSVVIEWREKTRQRSPQKGLQGSAWKWHSALLCTFHYSISVRAYLTIREAGNFFLSRNPRGR